MCCWIRLCLDLLLSSFIHSFLWVCSGNIWYRLLGFKIEYWIFLYLKQVGFYVRNYVTLHIYWYLKMGIIATAVALQIWDDRKGKELNLWNTGEEKELYIKSGQTDAVKWQALILDFLLTRRFVVDVVVNSTWSLTTGTPSPLTSKGETTPEQAARGHHNHTIDEQCPKRECEEGMEKESGRIHCTLARATQRRNDLIALKAIKSLRSTETETTRSRRPAASNAG
jgi:hypothetical protein